MRSSTAPITCGWQRNEYGILHLVVGARRAMGFADRAARHQAAQRCGDIDLALLAAQRMDARIERRVGAFQRIGRHRAGDERGGEHLLDLEQPAERQRGRNLRAVEQREAFLRAERQRLQDRRFPAPSPPAAISPFTRASPTPISSAAICASGARSPDAPTEPFDGMQG